MKTFNDEFNLGDSFSWGSLEYDNACDSSVVKALIGPMMGGLTSVGFISGPYGSLLRFAEGIDSLRNLAKTGNNNLTETQRAQAIVCSVAQLGGIIWIAISTIFLAIFCMCAPIGAWACLRCFRICRGASRRNRYREAAIDYLIAERYGNTDSIPSLRNKIAKQKIHVDTGHVLISNEFDQI